MIKLQNVNKKYGNKTILNDINLQLDKSGFVAFLGPSGSGKTTLLNILSLIDFDYTGVLDFGGINPQKLQDYTLEKFRLKNVSLVFQDFNLLSSLSLEDNLNLSSDINFTNSKATKSKRNLHYLKSFGLSNEISKDVSQLSGGEQQRLCLIRSLNLNSKIILLDEPTGALDKKQSHLLFSFLQGISKKKLIIVASHDEELVKQYAEKIYRIHDGEITEEIQNEIEPKSLQTTIVTNLQEKRKPNVPLPLIFRQYRGVQKKGRLRSYFTSLITSISLFSVGASSLLSQSIQTGINKAFEENLQTNSIIMSPKEYLDENLQVQCASYKTVSKIQKAITNLDTGVFPHYFTNFEDLFQDENSVYLNRAGPKFTLECYQIRNVNSYVYLDNVSPNTNFFPVRPSSLGSLEVILALPYHFMERLCFTLQIERSFHRLGEYISQNGLGITLSVQKQDWSFERELNLNVTAVIEDEDAHFIHSDNLWSEVIFEEYFKFQSSHDLSKVEANPWTFKKGYFLEVSDPELFLKERHHNSLLNNYLFEPLEKNRFLVYENNTNYLTYQDYERIRHLNTGFKKPIFSTYGFYGVYGSNILQGFSHPLYLSKSQAQSDLVLDTLSSLNIRSEEFVFDKREGIASGYFLFNEDVVRFQPIHENSLNKGRLPEKLDEIVISQGLADYLGITNLESTIYLNFINNELVIEDRIVRDFTSTTLTVCGFTRSNQQLIYHDPLWILDYPLYVLRVSPFLLLPFNFTFLESGEQNNTAEFIDSLNENLLEYHFSNPLHEVNQSIAQITKSLEIILLIFASITFILAIILLNTTIYLSFIEIKRDLGLLRINGASKSELRKIIVMNVLFHVLKSLILSFVQLLALSFIIGYILQDIFKTSFNLFIGVTPFLLTGLTAFLAFILISILLLFRFKKLDALSLLKY